MQGHISVIIQGAKEICPACHGIHRNTLTHLTGQKKPLKGDEGRTFITTE